VSDLKRPPQKNTTLQTVAREAGVSLKSVSRVLNGEPCVSEKMRCGVVLVESSLKIDDINPSISKVGIDDYAAGYELGNHFIKCGHKRIGYIGLREQHITANRRGKGLQAAMSDAGIDLDNFLAEDGFSTFKSGFQATDKFLSLENPPTAIFAGNDYMAAGAIACATRRGLKIPEDISIAGFDGADLSEMFVPPFTTVKQPLKDYGHWAAKQLLRAIALPEDVSVQQQKNIR